jgi:hypothetical protein
METVQNMKNTVLFNSSDKDILEYRIEEAQIDPYTGDLIWDETTQTYKKTGRTLEWTIKAGEIIEFPRYVADYLLSIYGFLEVKNPRKVKAVKADPEEVSSIEDNQDGKDSTEQ